MSEVEQLAQEQFNTFKNRLCEILSELEEEYKSVFAHGYAKGETDEKFRAKQATSSPTAELVKAKGIIKRMLPLIPNGYNDMGNSDFVYEVKEEAERFLGEQTPKNELSTGFTGVEINGVRFSNLSEMLQYMDKQREQLLKARQIIEMVTDWQLRCGNGHPTWQEVVSKATQFLNEVKV